MRSDALTQPELGLASSGAVAATREDEAEGVASGLAMRGALAYPEGMAATIGRRSGRLGRFGHVHLAEANQREVTERRDKAAFRELHAVRAGEPFGIARPGELGGAEAERTHHRL